jgi:hypothetical protein
MVDSLDDLLDSKMAVLLKDRGSGSTCVYQGMRADGGGAVMKLMKNLYDKGFLIKEDLTIVVVPYEYESYYLSKDKHRDDDERDMHDGLNELERYMRLRFTGWRDVFTNRIIYIKNDPSGKEGPVYFPALISSILIYATEKQRRGELELVENKPIQMKFPIVNVVEYVEDKLESDSSPSFRKFIGNLVWGDKRKGKYLFTCGDVGFTKFDLMDNLVEFEIRPQLDELADKE